MGKFYLFIILIFLSVLTMFLLTNPGSTTMTVPFDKTYQVTNVSLIMFSAIFGALASLIIFVIRDFARYVATFQLQRSQKRESRVQKYYGKAINAIMAEDDIEARRALGEVLKEEPNHINAHLRLGDLVFGDEAYADALEYYKKALGQNPKNIEALFSAVRVNKAMGRNTDAFKRLEEILEIDPDNLRALYGKREILEKEEKWDDLIDIQKSILKADFPEKEKQREQAYSLGYRYEKGRSFLENSEFEKASKEFKAILRMDEKFVPAHLGVAEVIIAQGDNEEAVEYLEKAFGQTGSHIVLARLEDLLISTGDPGRLISIYKSATAKSPQDSLLKFFLGKLFYRLEMIDDAFEVLGSIEIAGKHPEIHTLLAGLYLRRYQYAKASEEFRKVVDLKHSLRLPYCCTNCGHISDDWSGRCPRCGTWNTFRFNLHGSCKA